MTTPVLIILGVAVLSALVSLHFHLTSRIHGRYAEKFRESAEQFERFAAKYRTQAAEAERLRRDNEALRKQTD